MNTLEARLMIVVSKWKDARDVLMLSTIRNMDKRVLSLKTDENKTPKLKPAAIIAYNNGKCGIDRSDQMASYSTCSWRGVKWYRKVVFELLTGITAKNMVGPKEKVVHLLKKIEEKTRKKYILCYKKLTKEMSRAEARKKVKKVRTYCGGCDGKPIMCMDCHIEHHS
ncbi:hypothetical protein NQ314_001385 [Rhamnusium bicolor]|uniref:PiggyBac transposable element-derived protein domain-containing protein n=1 Tax=Rhamnusium bicolor TaxID=1586634 RepID=A0AAV8ZSB9_9CUCU|nr:hypothetical protein NQ314_001385 [Rhamnusium bicolor]